MYLLQKVYPTTEQRGLQMQGMPNISLMSGDLVIGGHAQHQL